MAQPKKTSGDGATSDAIQAFIDCANTARLDQNLEKLSDEDLAQAITAAIRLYAARTEQTGNHPEPLTNDATATDAIIAITAFMRFCDLNAFDVNMWLSRMQTISDRDM